MIDRDPLAYSPFWADRRLRRRVLALGAIVFVLLHGLLFVGARNISLFSPLGFAWFLTLTWYAGGFRCPRCKQRFGQSRLGLLLGSSCAHCGLLVDAIRDLDEQPLFPELRLSAPGGSDDAG